MIALLQFSPSTATKSTAALEHRAVAAPVTQAEAGSRKKRGTASAVHPPQRSHGQRFSTKMPVTSSELVAKFRSERDPEQRAYLAGEFSTLETSGTVWDVLDLVESETFPKTKAALFHALPLASLKAAGSDAVQALQIHFVSEEELVVRNAIIKALGRIQTRDAAEALRQISNDALADPAERVVAAACLLRLNSKTGNVVSLEQTRLISDRLKLDFQAGIDADTKAEAAAALQIASPANQPFLREAFIAEKDPRVKEQLEELLAASYYAQ